MKKWRWSLKYNPDQPRVPAGDSQGGQWTSSGGGGGSAVPAKTISRQQLTSTVDLAFRARNWTQEQRKAKLDSLLEAATQVKNPYTDFKPGDWVTVVKPREYGPPSYNIGQVGSLSRSKPSLTFNRSFDWTGRQTFDPIELEYDSSKDKFYRFNLSD